MVKRRPAPRGRGGWVFLGGVVLLHAVVAVLDAPLTGEALRFFAGLAEAVVPALGVVFMLLFLLDLFLSREGVEQLLGETSGVKGWVAAIAAGVLSTGPIYAWYALVAELRGKGMRTSLAAAFLYARAVKLPLLPMLMQYFGLRYTLVLSLYLIVFAVLTGLAMGRLDRETGRRTGVSL